MRTYGRVLGVDSSTSMALLEHLGTAILVDLSLCLGGTTVLPVVKDTIGVLGYTEARDPVSL